MGYFLLGLASLALVSCSKPARDSRNPSPLPPVHDEISPDLISSPSLSEADSGEAHSPPQYLVPEVGNSPVSGFESVSMAAASAIKPSIETEVIGPPEGEAAEAVHSLAFAGGVTKTSSPPGTEVIGSPGREAVRDTWVDYNGNTWVDYVDKQEFDVEKRPGSHVFDWYMGVLLKDTQETLQRWSRKHPDKDRWKKRFEAMAKRPPGDLINVFDDMIYHHSLRQNEGLPMSDIKNEKGEIESVAFVASFNEPIFGFDRAIKSESYIVDRIVLLGTDYLESNNFFSDERDAVLSFIEFDSSERIILSIREQAKNMVTFVDYVRKNKIPVHIMGKCEYFCSNYLLSAAPKVIIEPIGEVIFNGDPLSTAAIFEDVSKSLKEKLWIELQETATNPTEFAKLIKKKFDLTELRGFSNFLRRDPNSPSADDFLMARMTGFLGDQSFKDMPESVVAEFAAGMSLDERKSVMLFLKDKFGEDDQWISSMQIASNSMSVSFRHLSHQMLLRYGKVDKTLREFYRVVGLMTRFPIIEELCYAHDLPVCLDESSEIITYPYVSVDASVLRLLGFNVEGAENVGLREVIWPQKLNRPEMLSITEASLTECDFLNNSFSDVESIVSCLADVDR